MSLSIPQSPRAALRLTPLEDRTTPAVTATFAAGLLTITGDAAANSISVQVVSGQVKAFDGTTDLLPGTTITQAALRQISILGDAGDDTLIVDAPIKAPATIQGGLGDDLILGGVGNDVINAGDGINTVEGRDGNDSITGGADPDVLSGGRGADTITGGGDADLIFGGGDAGGKTDKLADRLTGGDGDDSIYGSLGNDVIDAGAGNDLVEGDAGNDSITAGPGADPGVGDDDFAYGGAGNDTITGGWGLDALYGEAGLDNLTGGAGNDTLSGGLNRDVFVGHGTGAPGLATAADNFDTYKDEFDLNKPVFGKASVLALAGTELDISDTLAALGSMTNTPSGFNPAARIRHLGSGEFLVRLGDVSVPGAAPVWVPVSFDGTWTDNDATPNAQERLLAAKAATEKREFWPLLFHRARMAGKGTFTFDTYITQPDYDTLSVNPGVAVQELSDRAATAGPFTFVGTTPPTGFGLTDIQNLLKTFKWLTVTTSGTPATGLQANQSYAIVGTVVFQGTSYIKLYNPSGFDTGVAGTANLDPGTAAKKNDGFITVSVTDFFNAANFATAYVN